MEHCYCDNNNEMSVVETIIFPALFEFHKAVFGSAVININEGSCRLHTKNYFHKTAVITEEFFKRKTELAKFAGLSGRFIPRAIDINRTRFDCFYFFNSKDTPQELNTAIVRAFRNGAKSGESLKMCLEASIIGLVAHKIRHEAQFIDEISKLKKISFLKGINEEIYKEAKEAWKYRKKNLPAQCANPFENFAFEEDAITIEYAARYYWENEEMRYNWLSEHGMNENFFKVSQLIFS